MKPDIELVTTGAELLNGSVVNRHAQWLGRALDLQGWSLRRDTTVPDDREAMRDAIFSALMRCDVVVVTGGLGPTSDDVTREVAAEWTGRELVMHEPSRQAVLDAYRRRNKPLNSMVERHALIVAGAMVLDNRHGLAPGEHLQKDGKHLFLLPGPPHEFQGVMQDHVLPWLERQGAPRPGRRQLFQVVGLGESDIAARLASRGFDGLRIDTAYCAAPARVTIRIREENGAHDFDSAAAIIRSELGSAVYSEQDEGIEQVILRECISRGLRLAVAESCTGGLIAQRLTARPGSSAFFQGGVIAYHNELKEKLLGVSPRDLDRYGAVSEPVAQSMAEGIKSIARVDIGLAITGIAGPDGGTPEKPVGLVFIAVADGKGTEVRALRLGGGREIIREAAASLALDLVRQRWL